MNIDLLKREVPLPFDNLGKLVQYHLSTYHDITTEPLNIGW